MDGKNTAAFKKFDFAESIIRILFGFPEIHEQATVWCPAEHLIHDYKRKDVGIGCGHDNISHINSGVFDSGCLDEADFHVLLWLRRGRSRVIHFPCLPSIKKTSGLSEDCIEVEIASEDNMSIIRSIMVVEKGCDVLLCNIL